MIKNVDILVGCQFGSEAKGLVASKIAQMNDYDWIISVNSAQAGHTAPFVTKDDVVQVVTRQLPSACVTNHIASIYLGMGAVINWSVLEEECERLEKLGIPIYNRLYVDPMATLIREEDIEQEKDMSMKECLGSTCEGVGSALSRRAMRLAGVASFISDSRIKVVRPIMYGNIFLEGSQGFGLSVYSIHYPKSTSRDTTASAFLSYAGLSPFKVRDVYGVYRTYPIRVGGNSGDMYRELTWEEIAKRSGYEKLSEYTTVTGRLRRIGEWDVGLAREATRVNGVTKPILTFANYLDCTIENCTNFHELSVGIVDKLTEMSKDVVQQSGGFWYGISTSKTGGWIIID